VRSFAFYSVLRLGLFFVVAVLLVALGAGPLLATALAVFISAGLSYLLLRRQRDAVAAQVAERISQRLARRADHPDPDAVAEDALVDAPRKIELTEPVADQP
jgi:hypothetical protein